MKTQLLPRLRLMGAVVLLAIASFPSHLTALPSVWINEIHYDNTGTDTGEFIEIAGEAGTDLTGYKIVLYNGADGMAYDTDTLSGLIANQQNGFGTISLTYPVNGIQNGAPDGIALVRADNSVVQFLSYEGSFTALNGAANGMTSTDIGVSEAGTDVAGMSLQLKGSGSSYSDFAWSAPSTASAGAVNSGQTFRSVATSVPEALPSWYSLFLLLPFLFARSLCRGPANFRRR